jgi:hypothetical protein
MKRKLKLGFIGAAIVFVLYALAKFFLGQKWKRQALVEAYYEFPTTENIVAKVEEFHELRAKREREIKDATKEEIIRKWNCKLLFPFRRLPV